MVGIHSMMRPGVPACMQTTMRFGLILPIPQMYLGTDGGVYMSVDRATTGNLFVVFRITILPCRCRQPISLLQSIWWLAGQWFVDGTQSESRRGWKWRLGVSLWGDGFWVKFRSNGYQLCLCRKPGWQYGEGKSQDQHPRAIKPFEEVGDENWGGTGTHRWWCRPIARVLCIRVRNTCTVPPAREKMGKLSGDLSTNDKENKSRRIQGTFCRCYFSRKPLHHLQHSRIAHRLQYHLCWYRRWQLSGDHQWRKNLGQSCLPITLLASPNKHGYPASMPPYTMPILFLLLLTTTHTEITIPCSGFQRQGKHGPGFTSNEFTGFANKILFRMIKIPPCCIWVLKWACSWVLMRDKAGWGTNRNFRGWPWCAIWCCTHPVIWSLPHTVGAFTSSMTSHLWESSINQI